MPELRSEIGPLTLKLERVIHMLESVRIEEIVESSWRDVGRPPHDGGTLASAFVAKAVLGLTTATALIERVKVDRALRLICGFSIWKPVPDPSTFSRAFDEFAQTKLGERVHEALVQEQLGETLIGHTRRDGTAIEARERSARKEESKPAALAKRGRPLKDEVREPKLKTIARQLGQNLAEMLVRTAEGMRSWHEVQCATLQDPLERPQAAHRHGRLRRSDERTHSPAPRCMPSLIRA